ncbi:MAG: S8 family serine peptidase [Bdellovibrionales bacterium]|nr:S8 family serine peptidase [Bdellovibrionales bacterium]
MRHFKAASWFGLSLLLTPFFFNCHQSTDQSAAVNAANTAADRQPDSEDQTVRAMTADGAAVGESKVRITTAVLGAAAPAGAAGKLGDAAIVPAGTKLLALYDNNCRGTESNLRYEAEAMDLAENKSMNELENMAESDPCLMRIDENHIHTLIDPVVDRANAVNANDVSALATTNDPRLAEARHITFTKTLSSWDWFYSGVGINQDVLVAVVDTGVLYTHPDLADNVYSNSNGQHGYDFINDDNDPIDDNGHGTHVSGIIAARANNGVGVTGVMGTRVKVMGIKVLNAQGSGDDAAIVNGIRYAADQGAQVMNMSLGGKFQSTAIRDAMVYAAGKGTVIVVAAGNSNEEITSANFYAPSGYSKDIPGCLSVGSVDAVTGARSSFSNTGAGYVWIAAPGSNGILSTYLANGYTALQGTSMASPVVAGAAALLVGAYRSRGLTYTPTQVVSLLTDSARPVTTLSTVFRNGATLDVERAAKLFYSRYVMSGDAGTEAQ